MSTSINIPTVRSPFFIQGDASNQGLGTVLTQEIIDGEEKVIANASRGLKGPETHYTTNDREGVFSGNIWIKEV